jgi:hypothetical protein
MARSDSGQHLYDYEQDDQAEKAAEVTTGRPAETRYRKDATEYPQVRVRKDRSEMLGAKDQAAWFKTKQGQHRPRDDEQGVDGEQNGDYVDDDVQMHHSLVKIS